MNVLNMKARALRTHIEAEKRRDTPNQKTIEELEKELVKTLEGLRWK